MKITFLSSSGYLLMVDPKNWFPWNPLKVDHSTFVFLVFFPFAYDTWIYMVKMKNQRKWQRKAKAKEKRKRKSIKRKKVIDKFACI